MTPQKDIKQRLAFMMEGIKVQAGFNWGEYAQLCHDALAHIVEQDREILECRRIIALDTETVNEQAMRIADLERKLKAQQQFSFVKVL